MRCADRCCWLGFRSGSFQSGWLKGPGLYLVAASTVTAKKHLTICFSGKFRNVQRQAPILLSWTSNHNFSLRAFREIREFAITSRALFFFFFWENASFFPHPVSLKPLTVTAGGLSGMNRLGRKSPHPHTVWLAEMAACSKDENANTEYCAREIGVFLNYFFFLWTKVREYFFYHVITTGFIPAGFNREEIQGQRWGEWYLHNNDSRIYFECTAEASGVLPK